MDEDEINYLRELRQAHRNRLRVLELKAAQYGINCPPEVQTEISEIKNKIEALDQQIRDPNKSPHQLILPQDRAANFKKLTVPSAIALLGFIVLMIISILINQGLLRLATNPTSVASSTVSTLNVLTPKPMSQSIASIKPQEGGVSQVKADSLRLSWMNVSTPQDGLPLRNGSFVPFSQMKSFEIINDEGPDNITVTITLLDGRTMTERLTETWAQNGVLGGKMDIGSFSLGIHQVTRVDFQR